MNCNLKISVIIPVFNTADYLPRCLDSILNNDYKNLEIICINDGSTDNCLEILKEYENKDDRILLIDVPNGGVSKARNLGLDYATGDYICFIDSDDWIHRQFFSALLFFSELVHADIVVCPLKSTNEYFEDERIEIQSLKYECFDNKSILENRDIKSFIGGRIYRNSCIGNHHFREEVSVSEDKLFNLLIVSQQADLCILLLKKELYYYYHRVDSAINTSQGPDFKVLSYIYLDYAEKSSDVLFISYFLNEAFKNSFAVRYSLQFDKNIELKNDINQFIKRCLTLEKSQKPFSWKKSISLRLFAHFPALYRCFRIMNDPTMLVWEKGKKKELKRKE